MKSFLFILFFIFSITSSNAQDYLINFTGTGGSAVIDSIKVENLTQETTLTMNGSDVLHLVETAGINPYLLDDNHLKIYPNPTSGNSILQIFPPKEGLAVIQVFDLTGKLLTQIESYLMTWPQEFIISGIPNGFYLISVKGNSYNYSGKLVCKTKTSGSINIEKLNENLVAVDNTTKVNQQNSLTVIEMAFNDGDRLKFIGMSGIYATVFTDIPEGDETITFNFIACTDSDNNHYAIVEIGDQVWMAENLAYLPSVSPSSEGSLNVPFYYVNGYQGNNVEEAKSIENYHIYGVLYNWPAAIDVCPSDWHLPSDGEWSVLTDYVGGFDVAGGKLKETGTSHWENPNTNATNEVGFTSLPGGDRGFQYGVFGEPGTYGVWWTALEESSNYAWYRFMANDENDVSRNNYVKTEGYSVRCVKN